MPKTSLLLPSAGRKLLLLIPALFIIVAAVFVAKWCLGNVVATQLGNAKTPEQITLEKDLADFSTGLAPDDPQTFYSTGVVLEKSDRSENFPQIVQLYEKAVSLTPNDYRYWLTLGKIRERAGDASGGEKAVRRALELAPNYSQVNWTLGNILLRQNKVDEGFQYLQQAATTSESFAPSVVGLAWQFYNGDMPTVLAKVGDSNAVRASLAVFLAREKRIAEASKLWNDLSPEEKQVKFKESGNELFNNLIKVKSFSAALTIKQSQLAAETEKPETNRLLNPGFEADNYLNKGNTEFFGWQIAEAPQPQIAVDETTKQDGARSLIIVFNSPSGKDFRQVSQNVTVVPNTSYHLEFAAKTANLKAKETLRWEIFDLNDEKIIAASVPVAGGDSDWQKLTVDFTTAANTEAVRLQLARVVCVNCTISGKVWFDSFNLQKIGEGKN